LSADEISEILKKEKPVNFYIELENHKIKTIKRPENLKYNV
jgi:hypothetical protein